MYFVYILQCADKTLYVGYTTDLEHRLHAHNNLKSGAKYTRARRPVIFKYSEKFETSLEAHRREIELKGWSRVKKLQLFKKEIEE